MEDMQMLTRRTQVVVQKSKTCNRGRESRCRSRRRAIVDACRGTEVQQWTRWTRVAFRTPRLYRPLSLLDAVTLTPSCNAASHVPSSSPKQKTLSLSSAGDRQRWRSDPAGMGPLQEGAVHLPAEPLRHLHGRPLERGNNGLLAPLLFPILPSFFNPILLVPY